MAAATAQAAPRTATAMTQASNSARDDFRSAAMSSAIVVSFSDVTTLSVDDVIEPQCYVINALRVYVVLDLISSCASAATQHDKPYNKQLT